MFTPRNLYPARNVDTNSHIEAECFNLLNRGDVIPLGLRKSNIRSSKSSTSSVLVELFYGYSGQ